MGEQDLFLIRDRAAEKRSAMAKQALRVGELIEGRNTGRLGDEAIKMAQVMLLCALPYSRTEALQVTRRAQLGDRSDLVVTFTAAVSGVPLPFGADRRLLAWLLDKSVRSTSLFINWESAWEYQEEMGLGHGGRDGKKVQASFQRISGLAVSIQRKTTDDVTGTNFFVIEDFHLPRSIAALVLKGKHSVAEIAPASTLYGVFINPKLHEDMRRHHVSIPRGLWKQKRGSAQVQDMILWLYVRCYAAQSESVIPWDALADQFGADSNPRRQRAHACEAVAFLKNIWPGCKAEIIGCGILVDKVTRPFLEDDPSRKRFRRLE